MNNCCDLLVVGGGINGAGIARDAAGRGLSVVLVEKDDLAAHTSSASSKLIHGGLRYLEQLDLRLVRQSLAERERLLRAAPHIVRPLEFVLPITPGSRPGWMIRAGLFLYDHLAARRVLPGSRAIRLPADERGAGLRTDPNKAFAYWDARVQDSRLVVLNAMDAAERGATVLTRAELIEARPEEGRWTARLRTSEGDTVVGARALVNAAGPWAVQLAQRIQGPSFKGKLRLVKGSHIVVPRLYPGDHAFLLQNPDGRVVFAIPFEGQFTLVGTTDVEWTEPPGGPSIADDEVEYLLDAIGRYFTPVPRSAIVWSYSGLRALVDDGAANPSKVTRDHALELHGFEDQPPLLTVLGGKITTHRRLAEEAVGRLAPYFAGLGPAWTDGAILPGGDIPDLDLDAYVDGLGAAYPSLPRELLARLGSTYGTRTERLLDGARTVADLGEHFGSGLYAREIDYLVAHEWARTAEDVLFRRTKLGLHVGAETADRLTGYLSAARAGLRSGT